MGSDDNPSREDNRIVSEAASLAAPQFDVDSTLELDKVEQESDSATAQIAGFNTKEQSWRRRLLATGMIVAGLVAMGVIANHAVQQQRLTTLNASQPDVSQTYKIQSISLPSLSRQLGANSLTQAHSLQINGLLGVNDSLVLKPMPKPSNAVTGQVYFDESRKQLAYFNGSQFVYLQTPIPGVTSVGGATGAIALAAGLAQNGNTLSNTGVLAIGGQSGSIALGNGLAISNGKLFTTDIRSINTGSSNLTITNDGDGNLTITDSDSSGTGGGGTVSSPGGTSGHIAEFTGSQTIADSILTQSGTTVTVAGTLGATTLSGNGSSVTNVDAATLNGNSSSFFTNATNISSGTLASARLSSNVTLQGNSFNAANELLQLNATGGLPALDGSLLTNLNASNLTLGTVADVRLSNNVTLQGNTFNGSDELVQLNATSGLPALNGSLLTNLDASSLASGTVPDTRLSANVALLGNSNNFTGVTLQHNGNDICDNSNNCGYLTGSAASGLYIQLQSSTPGAAQTGHFNISGTGIAGSIKATTVYQNGNQVCDTSGNCAGVGGDVTGTGTTNTIAMFTNTGAIGNSIITQSGTTVTIAGTLSATNLVGDGSGVTNVNAATLGGNASGYFTNATNIASGTLSDSRLSTNVTLQGNIFNGANELVQLNATGGLPALDGSLLTNLDASNIATGTLANARLSASVTLQGNTFNGGNELVQLNATAGLPALNGSLLTSLDAGNISAGTLADARLSSNVALLNAASNNFTGATLQHNGNNLCDASNNCSYAPASGSNNYVQFAPASAQTDATANNSVFVNKTGISGNIIELQKAGGNVFTIGNTGVMTLLGNLLPDITTAAASTANSLTIQPGNSTLNSGTGATLALQAGDATGTSSFGGDLNLDAGSGTNLDGAINIGANHATSVNIGQFSANGYLSVGNTGIEIFTNSISYGTTIVTNTNTDAALQVQNSSNYNVLSVDTSTNKAVLGDFGLLNGALEFQNASNVSDITLTTGATSSSYSLILPTSGPSTSQCLQTDATTASQLVFGSCGAGGTTTLQDAYNNSAADPTPEITLDSTHKALTIRDNATPITGDLLDIQDNTGSTTYLGVASTGVTTSGNLAVNGGQITSTGALSVSTGGTSNLSIVTPANSSTTGSITIQSGNSSTATAGSIIIDNGTSGGGSGLIFLGASNNALLEMGNTAGTVSIEGSSSATGIQIGNGATVHGIQIGTGAAAQTVTIGSTDTSSSTTIQGGTGGSINIGSVGASTLSSATHIADTTNATGTQTVTIGSTGNTANTVTLQAGATSESLTNAGATLKTTTASATAFQVQDANGTNMFGVNTDNGLINDNMTTNSPTGTFVNGASWVSGQYVELNNGGPGVDGEINYTESNTGNSFDATFDFWSLSGGSDGTWFYAYDTQTPSSYHFGDPNGGYDFAYSDQNSDVELYFNGTLLASAPISAPNNSTWHTAEIKKAGNTMTMYYDGSSVLTYTDSVVRALTGTNFGLGGCSCSASGEHRAKNFTLTSDLAITDAFSQFNTGINIDGQATASMINVAANGNTIGNALNLSDNGLTTGNGINLSTTSASQTSGSLFNASDTAALTTNGASITGSVLNASRSITANISGNSVTAPAFDAVTQHKSTGSTAQTQSFTITVNSHSNRFLMVWVLTQYNPPTNVTYNSTQMTNIGQQFGNISNFVWSLWVLPNPTVGTTLSVTVTQSASNAGAMDAIASSWYNVSQSNPWQYWTTNTGASGQPSMTAVSASGQLIVDTFYEYTCTSGDTSAAGTGQTKVTSYTEPTYDCGQVGESYKTSGGVTTPMSWTGTQGAAWDEGAIGLNGVPASTASVTGAVASISSNCSSTTANACVDSGNVLSVSQSDVTATGSTVKILNASSAPALQVQSTSGTTAMSVYTMGAQSVPLLGDGVLNLGEIDGVSITSTGSLNTGGADYAEYFYQGVPGSLSPGDVVCLDGYGRAIACNGTPSASIAGVVSTKASVVGNASIHHAADPNSTVLVGMLGQLKVKVSTANGPIEPGDMLTMSSTPGVAVKATTPGMTIGSAMQAFIGSGTGQVMTYVHVGYFDPTTSNGSYMQDGAAVSLASLNVSGNTTLTNLTVTGVATFATITTQTLTVGHIVTDGGAPAVAANTSICGGATASIRGTDTAGLITVTTGASCGDGGKLATITFNNAFSTVPYVNLTPGNAATAGLSTYVDSGALSTTSFDISTSQTNVNGSTTYQWYYHVIQ